MFKNIFKKKITEKKKSNYPWNKIFHFQKIDEKVFSEIEESLIQADCDLKSCSFILNHFKNKLKEKKTNDKDIFETTLKKIILSCFSEDKQLTLAENKLNVLLISGINGVGKTTSIAKIAHYYQTKQNKKVSLGAADTFRAAAFEQLNIWGKRLGVNVSGSPQAKDPSSVAYDAIESALSKKHDLCIIDTAGRLENKEHLMEQLTKMKRVILKFENKINLINLIIIDTTLGKNSFDQVQIFNEKLNLNGIMITKLDTNAKGGILISIANTFKLPIYFIGNGEKLEDFTLFNSEQYVKSLL